MIFTKMTVARKRRQNRQDTAITKHGMLELGREIVSSKGVGALWSGLTPSLGLVSNIFLQYLLFNRLKRVLASVAKRRNRGITQLELFAAQLGNVHLVEELLDVHCPAEAYSDDQYKLATKGRATKPPTPSGVERVGSNS